jgi:ketopantoate reductase
MLDRAPRESPQTDGDLRNESVAATPTRVTSDQINAASRPVKRAQRQSVGPGVAPVSVTIASAGQIYHHGTGSINGGSMASAEAQHGKQLAPALEPGIRANRPPRL